MRLPDFFDKQADAQPNATAVVYDNRSWTYRDIQDDTRRIARALMETGLSKGAKIASWLPNSPSFFFRADRHPSHAFRLAAAQSACHRV